MAAPEEEISLDHDFQFSIGNTGPIGSSDCWETEKVSLYAIVTLSDDFQYKKILFGDKKLTL